MRPPICITGMHRSGTSMMAMLLHACGLRVGRKEHFAPADVDNQLGYWEDLRFVRLNDAVLRAAGGAWDRPPPEIKAPGNSVRERWLAGRARRLTRRSGSDHPWGWKDPRSALTMPFWIAAAPDLRVVICLRHPGWVDQSLRTRTHWQSSDGESLWITYNERLLRAVPPPRRIIIANDAVLAEPAAALARVLEFVGLPRDRAEARELQSLVRPELQRVKFAKKRDCTPRAEALYRSMLAEAFPAAADGTSGATWGAA